MASDSEEKTSHKLNSDSPSVRFDLEGSQHPDEFDASLDEVDEFLELTTSSNLPSTSSLESTANPLPNGSATNAKKASMNSVVDENKSTLNRYKR
jgi:hypothetical protein